MPPKECQLCVERDKEIKRILKAYKIDKKKYQITILSLFALEILTIAFGKDGIMMVFNFIKDKL